MSTLTLDRRADSDDGPAEDGEDRMPRRPRRRLLTPLSALLLAAMMCAIGFYVGVRVEKGHIASSPTTIGAGGGFAARGAAAGGGTTGGSAAGGSTVGAPGAAGAAGFAGRLGNATFGTVASVDGKTLMLTEVGGDTVKVKLTSATKITKTESAKRSLIHPGDTITVSGVTGKQGSVSAASVSDTGANSTGGSSTSGSSTSSGGSSVSSLFSGG